MTTDPTDGKPGLRIETAASITLRDSILKHMHVFGHVIVKDRQSARQVTAAYVDGLAGAIAFSIQGGHGSKEELTELTILQLRDAIIRDLNHLKR